MSELRAVAIGALALGIAAILAYWTLLFFLQRTVLFPRPLAAGGDAGVDEVGGRRVWLDVRAGRAEAWFLPAVATAGGARPLVLFAHGNGELIDHWAREFDRARQWGLSVLLVEYPGYGRSSGSPSQGSITRTLVAAYDWAASQPFVDRDRILGYGRSLGGGAICALSRERRLAAMVLESTFTSVRSMAARFGLPGFLVRDPFDNAPALRAFPGPVLLVHGERDEIIPPAHARSLHAAAPRSQLHLLPCGHNDCPRPWHALERFLAAHGLR
jgi:fermentation-respiration switch protein FrsA (DUF1100 family)